VIAPEEPPCELLDWDTHHFGLQIARVTAGRLDAESAVAVDRFCDERSVRCLYLFADDSDAESARVAAEHGFRHVDLRSCMRHPLDAIPEPPPPSGNWKIRAGTEDDLDALGLLSARSHLSSRFRFDRAFPPDRVDALYALWVKRGLENEARALLVVELDGDPCGYQVIRPLDEDGTGAMELLAIDEAHRRKGVAIWLLCESLRTMERAGASSVTTVISARNVRSTRVHQRLGFLTERVESCHHRWYPATA
jgi:ribosomal protein S18 acetylase RimI-like enzyme